MDTTTATLPLLLRWIAEHRAAAARITVEIDTRQRMMNRLLTRRVPGDRIDAIEDEILALRARLMANDAAMMILVEHARRANDRRPERRRLDLEVEYRAMARASGGDHAPV
jgi:hypothetical protein